MTCFSSSCLWNFSKASARLFSTYSFLFVKCPQKFQNSAPLKKTEAQRGVGMAQWWEYSPPTSVARIRFSHPASYVGWVCWFSSLLREIFLRVIRFSSKTNISSSIWIIFKHFIMSLWLGWSRKLSLWPAIHHHNGSTKLTGDDSVP